MKHLEVDLSQGVAEALPAWVVVQLLPCYFLEPGEFQSYQNPTKQKEEEEEEKAQTSNTSWEEEKSPTDKNVVLW